MRSALSPKSDLTLSARPDDRREDGLSPLLARALDAGMAPDLAVQLRRAAWATWTALGDDADLTESEMRALWGDR